MRKQRRQRTDRKKLEAKLDDLFRRAVYHRDGFTCQVCGRNRVRIECSHFVGRRKRSTRWMLENADAKCSSCHRFMGENPGVFADWKRKRLGSVEYDALIMRGNQTIHWSLEELEDMAECLEQYLERFENVEILGGQRASMH